MSDRDQKSAVVAIPRVLWWFRLWPFWKTFFEEAGCRVITNEPSRPTSPTRDRSSTIVEESCYPMQLLIDRTLALASEADAVFMPRLISVDRRGILCPRFTGVPDIVQQVVGTDCRMLAPAIDAREGAASVRRDYINAAMELGCSRKQATAAWRSAVDAQKRFDSQFESRLNSMPTHDAFDPAKSVPAESTGTPKFRVALLGHPYITYDWEFSLRIVERLHGLGAWVVPVEAINSKEVERAVRRLDKNIYWTSGRDVLGAAMSLFESGRLDGIIHLSCFKCGVDGLLADVLRWTARGENKTPFLPLTLDGHDSEIGQMTRLEAFLDILRHRTG